MEKHMNTLKATTPNSTTSDVSTPAPTKEQQEAARQAAYQLEADPLFFKWQRGTATEAEWLDMIAEIKLRYPYPEAD
jgi:hypothetical protein